MQRLPRSSACRLLAQHARRGPQPAIPSQPPTCAPFLRRLSTPATCGAWPSCPMATWSPPAPIIWHASGHRHGVAQAGLPELRHLAAWFWCPPLWHALMSRHHCWPCMLLAGCRACCAGGNCAGTARRVVRTQGRLSTGLWQVSFLIPGSALLALPAQVCKPVHHSCPPPAHRPTMRRSLQRRRPQPLPSRRVVAAAAAACLQA